MKLLIVKISSLGDVVHTFALVNRLKSRLPEITIDWLVGENFAELVGSLEAVNRLHIFKRGEWGKKWWSPATHGEILSLISSLRSERYDVCLDLQGLLRSGLITFFSGATKRAGFSNAREGSRYCYDVRIDTGDSQHAVDKLLKSLSIFDITEPEVPVFEFPIPKNMEESAKKSLEAIGVKGKYLVFHAGARWATKIWPPDKWRELAKAVSQKCGLPILFTGSDDDKAMIDAIIGNEKKLFSLAGKIGLIELASILKKAELMVTVDSGPMHIAAAFSTPIVALFGPTSPKKTGPRSSGRVEIIQSALECVPCFNRSCDRDFECFNEIGPSAVEERVAKIFRELKVPYGTNGSGT